MSVSSALSEDRIETTLDVPEDVVEEIGERLSAAGEEPTDAAIRDRLYDLVELRPEWRAGGLPLADAVRDELGEE